MIGRMEWQQIIITGASSGFGEAFARRLAGTCRQMLLVARRADALQSLAAGLEAACPGLEAVPVPCDLADARARGELARRLQGLPAGRTLLVNNAGLGDYGEFAASDPVRNNEMVQVNMMAVAELARAVLPAMLEQRGGGIINVASLAADLPIPDFAMYAASKAFVASFSEALRLETKGCGVAVTAVCPGPVHTGFGETARRQGCSGNEMPLRQWFYATPADVVETALAALQRNKARCYPTLKVRLAGLLVRNLPLWLLRLAMGARPRKVKPLEE